ncbi:MAG TPA: hypothetical protein PK772_02815, partial [Chitinophagaceae bacterium]|nr:hypothetical protein [Chitinophagaceae bacterium]
GQKSKENSSRHQNFIPSKQYASKISKNFYLFLSDTNEKGYIFSCLYNKTYAMQSVVTIPKNPNERQFLSNLTSLHSRG